jgi:hypothetical protein
MIPAFEEGGYLPRGIHDADWDEFRARFGGNPVRDRLLSGLYRALVELRVAGCRRVFIDGSFVTNKEYPNDYDGCWESTGVDPLRLDPVLLTFDQGRVSQKAKYFGELFVAGVSESATGHTFLEFFQQTRDGDPKGLVSINLHSLP